VKRFFKILFITLGSIIGVLVIIFLIAMLWMSVKGSSSAKKYSALAGPEVQTLTIDGFTFRDLNKNEQLDIYLDRPAVIPEIAETSKGLLVNFGANDEALLDIVFGKMYPSGKLPFELPSSMDAVRKQKEDLPYDSENPLFPFGYGLSY